MLWLPFFRCAKVHACLIFQSQIQSERTILHWKGHAPCPDQRASLCQTRERASARTGGKFLLAKSRQSRRTVALGRVSSFLKSTAARPCPFLTERSTLPGYKSVSRSQGTLSIPEHLIHVSVTRRSSQVRSLTSPVRCARKAITTANALKFKPVDHARQAPRAVVDAAVAAKRTSISWVFCSPPFLHLHPRSRDDAYACQCSKGSDIGSPGPLPAWPQSRNSLSPWIDDGGPGPPFLCPFHFLVGPTG